MANRSVVELSPTSGPHRSIYQHHPATFIYIGTITIVHTCLRFVDKRDRKFGSLVSSEECMKQQGVTDRQWRGPPSLCLPWPAMLRRPISISLSPIAWPHLH